jgi:hypothetical protein
MLDHARSNLLYEKQLLKELELLRPELHGIRKPEPGVYYHTAPGSVSPNMRRQPSEVVQASPSMGRTASVGSNGARPMAGGGAPVLTRGGTNYPNGNGGRFEGDGTKSMYVGRGAPLFGNGIGGEDLHGAAPGAVGAGGTATKRSVRSMASSVVVADDRRQRVDVRVAFCFEDSTDWLTVDSVGSHCGVDACKWVLGDGQGRGAHSVILLGSRGGDYRVSIFKHRRCLVCVCVERRLRGSCEREQPSLASEWKSLSPRLFPPFSLVVPIRPDH